MPVVHNKHAPFDVYIGRGGPWGNPIARGKRCFWCGAIHQARGSTLKCYEQWLRGEMEQNAELQQYIKSLHGLTLGCWCHPHPCHGNTLLKIAKELQQE